MGSAYRMERFAVTDQDTVELDQLVSFFRIGYVIKKDIEIHAYLGYFSGGEITLSDKNITELDAHWGGALSFSFKI